MSHWQELHRLLILHNIDTLQLMGFVGAVIGASFAIYQLSETRKWNRRNASQVACYEFSHPPISESWKLIYEPIVDNHKKYDQLSDEQKEKAQDMLFFFEKLAISIEYKIVEKKIIEDYFEPYLSEFYEATREYIEMRQREKGHEKEYERFVTWIKEMKPGRNKTQGAIMNTGNVESNVLAKNTKSAAAHVNPKLLIPTTADIKGVLGKIDLSVVAASVCACGCSCHVENE